MKVSNLWPYMKLLKYKNKGILESKHHSIVFQICHFYFLSKTESQVGLTIFCNNFCSKSKSLCLIDRFYLQNHRAKANLSTLDEIEIDKCGNLSISNVGKYVKLRGFLQYQRFGQFAVIRDFSGLVQILFKDPEMIEKVKKISFESYIEVTGEVSARPNNQINEKMSTGCIEVVVNTLEVINQAKKELPFLIRDKNQPTEPLALQYRYLDLRQPKLQENLMFRSQIGKKMRDYLQDHKSFVEIITPTLSVRTPGGAQEFIVPSRIPNNFYSLVQSPQTYKQLAMIGGFEKYFQFAICYRDEGCERDRQPEFMQLDLEMANTTPKQIKNLLENTIQYSWPDYLPSLTLPFPTMTFFEAIETYGVDKPDTRFDWKIADVSRMLSGNCSTLFSTLLSQEEYSAKAFVIPGGQKYIKKTHIETWMDIARKETNLPGVYFLKVLNDHSAKGNVAKELSKEGTTALIYSLKAKPEDLIILAVGPVKNILKLLGKLRLLSVETLEAQDVIIRKPDTFSWLWVEDFPLFERDELSGELISCHHPFTAPHLDDVLLLGENPQKARSQHYDLVLNGCEIAGGSIRIHKPELQRQILKLLKIDDQHFKFLIEALECGAPPHGGIALGFDRYISLLRKTNSIRDVIAFPKSSLGKCLMTGAPTLISEKDMEHYHLHNIKS